MQDIHKDVAGRLLDGDQVLQADDFRVDEAKRVGLLFGLIRQRVEIVLFSINGNCAIVPFSSCDVVTISPKWGVIFPILSTRSRRNTDSPITWDGLDEFFGKPRGLTSRLQD